MRGRGWRPWPALWLAFILWSGGLTGLRAAPALPPPPDGYVADRAGLLPPAVRAELNARLRQFERDSSSQVVVWLERKLPPDAALEGYVHEVFRQWRIGQARTNNGILLAIFVEDHKVRIEVGRGLEGTFPDILAGRIINNEITPRFRANDYPGGVRAGVAGILAATRGEYRGTGTTVRERQRGLGSRPDGAGRIFLLIVVGLFAWSIFRRFRSVSPYSAGQGWTLGSGGWGGGGSGGSGGGGDSGGFSGGGGDSGGGGASGSW